MTQRRRFAPFNYDQAQRVGVDAPATVPIAGKSDVSDVIEITRLQEQVRASIQYGRGLDESVVLSASRTSVFQFLGALPTQTILIFTVPNGCVLVVEAIGWKFTDPFFAMYDDYRVELWVNDTNIPFWAGANQAQFPGPTTELGYGSFEAPLRIEPIHVPANAILRIALTELDATFTSFVACACRVMGKLRKTGGFT